MLQKTQQMYDALELLNNHNGVMQEEQFIIELKDVQYPPESPEEYDQLKAELINQELIAVIESDFFDMYEITEKGSKVLTEMNTKPV